MRRKEEMPNQLEKSRGDGNRPSTAQSKYSKVSRISKISKISKVTGEDNNEYDVENYYYEPEEYLYAHTPSSASLVVKEEKPFYIPLTDVPYPGEVSSDYDLKKCVAPSTYLLRYLKVI